MADKAYDNARRKVKELRGFYNHLIAYAMINMFLIIINVLTSPGNWWFYWVTIFWGFGLAWHGISVYSNRGLFSKEWEDRKMKEYMDKEE
jgi:hypothetical protein